MVCSTHPTCSSLETQEPNLISERTGSVCTMVLQHLPPMSLATVSKHLLLAALQQVTVQQFVPEGSESFVHLLS